MRSQLSDEEICSGMRASGALPSLRTVMSARTAMCCSRGVQTHVHVEIGKGHGLALGVFGGRRGGDLNGRLRAVAAARGGLAVRIGGAGKYDLAAGLLGLRRGGTGGTLRRAGRLAARAKLSARSPARRRAS